MEALTCPLCGGPGPEHLDEKYRQWCNPQPARRGCAIGIFRVPPGEVRERQATAIVKDELTAALLSRCRAPWGWGIIATPTPW